MGAQSTVGAAPGRRARRHRPARRGAGRRPRREHGAAREGGPGGRERPRSRRAVASPTGPSPTPGPGEVLVEVEAVSASRLDLLMLNGATFGPGVMLPRTLGGDPAGRILAAVGAGVDPSPHRRAGRRQAQHLLRDVHLCATGREADCRAQTVLGLHRDGGAADLVVVPARSAFPIPDGVSSTTAAAAVHTVPVALHMLRVAGGVPTGRDRRGDRRGGCRRLGGRPAGGGPRRAGDGRGAGRRTGDVRRGAPALGCRASRQGDALGGRSPARARRRRRGRRHDGRSRRRWRSCVDVLAWGGHAVICSGAPAAVSAGQARGPLSEAADRARLGGLRRRGRRATRSRSSPRGRCGRSSVSSSRSPTTATPYGAVLDPTRNGKVVMEVRRDRDGGPRAARRRRRGGDRPLHRRARTPADCSPTSAPT